MKARLMDRPEDYEKLGINPEQIETWEDARRNLDSAKGNWEWWYFDAILDNGVKAVIQFFTKAGMKNIQKDGDVPSVTIKITTADGKLYEDEARPNVSECRYGKEKCDVHIGECSFVGDFKEYDIYAKGKKGVTADLKLISHAKPYRPGTAYFDFGEGEYYTWLCAVPQGEVSGTLCFGGQTITVHGTGYHDHQWGNRFYLPEWNNWLWARQSFEDYSVLTFDFITSKEAGYKRIPIIFIQNKDGEIVFESRDNVKCTVPEMTEVDPASKKVYPKKICYEFDADGRHVSYVLESDQILEAQGFKNKPLVGNLIIKKIGMNLSYMRFHGKGTLKFNTGSEVIEREGSLIYEFMYPGENCKELMER